MCVNFSTTFVNKTLSTCEKVIMRIGIVEGRR